MPTLRDWLETIAFLIAFFTVLSVTDPAAAADLSGIGQERTMNRYLTEPEQARLLETLKGASGGPLAARGYAWVRALRHSGLRITEFALINVGDALAALRTGYLFIPREHRKGWKRTEREGAPKRNPPKDHQTYVTNALREALEDLLKCRLLPLGDLGCSENAPLIVARDGEWAKLSGFPPGVSPHWLRHTRAMNIMRDSTARDPRGVVQSALGHADIRSTGIYTQTPREDVEAALDAIDTTKPRRVTRAVLRREFEGRATA